MVRPWLAALVILASTAANAGSVPSSERQHQLLYLLRQDCGSCHGMTLKGGLGPPLLPAALADRADALLVDTILNGRAGTPMPPWAFEIGPAEAGWLVEQLKEGLPDDR
jgi:cytochrome c55X